MADGWQMEMYWRMPIALQEAALSLYARRLQRLYYGPGFKEAYEQFRTMQQASVCDVRKWQENRLVTIVTTAATRVPFYRDHWRHSDWRSVHRIDDLALLPRLDKQSLRQNEAKFLIDGARPKSLWLERTSGTTGTSLRIYWPKKMVPQWWALAEVAVRNVAHVAQDIPRAMVGGRPVIPGNTVAPPFWRFNRFWRQLYLSSYHVSRSTAAAYVKALRRYELEWVTGYGSAIGALAQTASEVAEKPLQMRAVIVSGDTLLPGMRSAIEKFFACKCYDSYGQAEGCCMAMECDHGRMHVIPAAGIWEILREDGAPCAPGEVGEIVATGLLNDVMPLVRYRLGDYAAWSADQACPCGNPQPIIERLEGRLDDYLITSDGRKIGRISTALKGSPEIHSAQIVQDGPGHAYVLVRPGAGYRSCNAAAVCEDIIRRVGNFRFEVVEVREIPKTPRGKTSLVVRLDERPELTSLYRQLLARQAAAVQSSSFKVQSTERAAALNSLEL
jgi:phenylacetate-CoA ligase